MKTHREILAKAATRELPDTIDESSPVSVEVVKELVEAGYLSAIDASSMDGTAFMEPRITLPGREYLAELQEREKARSFFVRFLKLSSPAVKWAWGVITAVLVGVVLFWITGK